MKITNRSVRRTALFAAQLAAFAVLSSPAVFAQDSSGDALLNGTFRFRYVATLTQSSTGVVTEVTTAEGVISFLGNGTYTIAAGSQWNDPTVSNGAQQAFPSGYSGTYSVNSAGIINALSTPSPNPDLSGDILLGTYSQGVLTASSTEDGLTDLFVAIAVGNVPTNATFNSAYWIGALDFAIGEDVDVKNALFEITPNGNGSLGALSIQGQANSAPNTWLTQSVSGATYNFASDGNAQFSIPAPTGVATAQILVSGSRTVYVSNDGNFMLGWTPNGYDILFGVKALPSSVAGADSQFTGLYFLGGMGDNPTVSGTENCGPYTFWGSLNADGNENEIVHQRLYWACSAFGTPYEGSEYPNPFDSGNWDETVIGSDGSASDSPLQLSLNGGGSLYGFGDIGGKCVPSVANAACAFVGIDNTYGFFGLTIGVHAPNFTGSGLYLNPIGVVNAASWQPVTASVTPGELLTLFGSFGSNLPVLISTGGQPFPNVLGTVQVYINGIQAPIYYISPTQISVIAPYELANATTYTAEIQVNNGGLLSNEVSVFLLSDADPGIFSTTENGIGFGIAEHADGSAVCDPTIPPCSGSVAQPGETIVVALGGMGTVSPTIADGAVPPYTSLSYIDDYPSSCDGADPTTLPAGCELFVYFHDWDNGVYYQPATVQFAGLYPGLASLYQMNVTVPSTVGPGDDIYVEVLTPYNDTVQLAIPVGGSANASTAKTPGARLRRDGTPLGGAAFGRPLAAAPHRLTPRPALVRRRFAPIRIAPPAAPQQ